MDARLRALSAQLRKMTSEDAATWLMETYPVHGDYADAVDLLAHRSWKRPDQIRLARHYLSKMPFAGPKVYEAFASFMSFDLLLKILDECWPRASADADLAMYYVRRVLERSAKNESDRELIGNFVASKTVSC